MFTNRRTFIKTISLASSGLLIPHNTFSSMKPTVPNNYTNNELLDVSYKLLQSWCQGLVDTQIINNKISGLNGGIVCPACARVHGRVGYAIFPLIFLADKSQDKTYLDAALNLYNWMEEVVSFPDGSWVNDANVNLWKGITVCTAITLAETLMYYEHVLDKKTYNLWRNRLIKAADYVYENFNIYTGNINYPATGSYALSLIGSFLDIKKYKEKGKQLGDECKSYFSSKDYFLFGEGNPQNAISPNGCRYIDLGYNVEESLPSLVLYGKLVNDQEMLDLVTKSLKTHAEFMLPDGAWDNSWGSRSFKWSYWGGTTSDGSQHAYALLADKNPQFYNIALQNTKLQLDCTHNNLLYGGLHTKSHGLLACNHPSFCHVKAMATVLQHSEFISSIKIPKKIELPRSAPYGVKAFSEIQTFLVSKFGWSGTITGYDMDYNNNTGGHPTGGALSMLWHEKTGPLFSASMNRYQLIEAANMQMQKNAVDIPLTPRIELILEGITYMNIYDKNANISYFEKDDAIVFKTRSNLKNEKEEEVPENSVTCNIEYVFKKDTFIFKVSHNSKLDDVKIVLPVISSNDEVVNLISKTQLDIIKPKCVVNIHSTSELNIIPTEKGRVFNFIPGLEALPIQTYGSKILIETRLV